MRYQTTKNTWACELDHDIVKSATWGSSEYGWNKWIARDRYMSVRLLHLFKEITAKGLHESTCQKPILPNEEESSWIEAKLQELEAAGIPTRPEGKQSEE